MKSRAQDELWNLVSSEGIETPSSVAGIESPWPDGTLWVHPATASFPVEWLVLEQRHRKPKQCLVVPADCRPLLGITDVEIPADQLGGPLAVRCHLGRWVGSSLLRQARATGQVAAQTLELIRQRAGQASTGELGDPLLGKDGGPSPTYEDWVEELEQACSALSAAAAPSNASETTGGSGSLSPLLTACAVLVISFGADVGYQCLGSAWVTLNRNASTPLSNLIFRRPQDLPSNFSQLIFSTAVTRGAFQQEEIALPPNAEYLMIYVLLDDTSFFPEYRLTILDEQQTQIWSVSGLHPIHSSDHLNPSLSTLVDRNVFQAEATYQVSIEGHTGDGWKTIHRRSVMPRFDLSTS